MAGAGAGAAQPALRGLRPYDPLAARRNPRPYLNALRSFRFPLMKAVHDRLRRDLMKR